MRRVRRSRVAGGCRHGLALTLTSASLATECKGEMLKGYVDKRFVRWAWEQGVGKEGSEKFEQNRLD